MIFEVLALTLVVIAVHAWVGLNYHKSRKKRHQCLHEFQQLGQQVIFYYVP